MELEFGKETHLKGIPVSDGVACARVCLFNEARHKNLPFYRVAGEGTDREISRVRRAFRIAGDQLNQVAKDVESRVGRSESEIFVAQRMIVEDESLHVKVFDAVEQKGLNAEAAITEVLDVEEERLLAIDNEYIRDRATDIGEIKRRLLDVIGDLSPSLLCSGHQHCQRGKNAIIVAEELTPTLTIELDTEHTMGFVTEKGGITSHAAILARSFGIPAVSGIKGIHSALTCGVELLVNGSSGEVIVWPSKETIASLPSVRKHLEMMPTIVDPVPEMQVMANLSLCSDVDEAAHMKAEGVGLYRTEFDFLAAGRLLAEDEMYERYVSVVEAMKGKPVLFRMLDVGADKSAPFFGIINEENPCLGLRGTRLLLARPDLLVPQARALARASKHGAVSVMYPMIVEREQFLEIRDKFREVTSGLDAGEIRHGVMLEVPSACLQAEEIMNDADFCSIGSNDLIQYLFAVDRNNDQVSYDHNPDRPVFWALMRNMVVASEKTGKHLSLCGEMAGDPGNVRRLAELGLKTVSVSSRLIPGVRSVFR